MFCYFILLYQDSWPPATWTLKSNSKFKILVNIFSLKQKTNQIVPDTIEKIKLSPPENSILFLQTINFVASRQRIEMGTCKTKAFLADLGLFTQILAYLRVIQTYSEPCVSLTYIKNSVIWRTVALRIRGIVKTLMLKRFSGDVNLIYPL